MMMMLMMRMIIGNAHWGFISARLYALQELNNLILTMRVKDRSWSQNSGEDTNGRKVSTNLFNITRLESGNGIWIQAIHLQIQARLHHWKLTFQALGMHYLKYSGTLLNIRSILRRKIIFPLQHRNCD